MPFSPGVEMLFAIYNLKYLSIVQHRTSWRVLKALTNANYDIE